MNYPESQQILDEIKKANKILLNCHRGPDSDSVGSALALKRVLVDMGKDVKVICPSKVPEDLLFLKDSDSIEEVSFSEYDFSQHDLFIAVDSSNYRMVSGNKDLKQPDIKTIVIDHHASNVGFGEINLIDSKITSSAELLYKIFSDWEVSLDEFIATSLLTGIIGDTGCFQYPGVGKSTFKVAVDLMQKGADKDQIIFNIYRSIKFETVKFWGKAIENTNKDESGFVWTSISNETYVEYGEDSSAKEDAANLFLPIVKDTDFGVIMVESEKDKLSVSFRSRKDFDVSVIAEEIGGGGHKAAAGAKVELPFDQAVEKVLTACRKYANKKS